MDDFRKILLTVVASMLMFVSATVIVTSENDMEVEADTEYFGEVVVEISVRGGSYYPVGSSNNNGGTFEVDPYSGYYLPEDITIRNNSSGASAYYDYRNGYIEIYCDDLSTGSIYIDVQCVEGLEIELRMKMGSQTKVQTSTHNPQTLIGIVLPQQTGYKTPTSVTVTCNSQSVPFTLVSNSVRISNPMNYAGETVTISAEYVPMTYDFTINIVNGSYETDGVPTYGQDFRVTITPDDHYGVPSKQNITVKMGGKEVTNYICNSNRNYAELVLEVTGKVEISVNCEGEYYSLTFYSQRHHMSIDFGKEYQGYNYGTGLKMPTHSPQGYIIGWFEDEDGNRITEIGPEDWGNKRIYVVLYDDMAGLSASNDIKAPVAIAIVALIGIFAMAFFIRR